MYIMFNEMSGSSQDGMDRMKNNSGPGILSNLPSTMYRWIEECRVLDGASVHDVVTSELTDRLFCT